MDQRLERLQALLAMYQDDANDFNEVFCAVVDESPGFMEALGAIDPGPPCPTLLQEAECVEVPYYGEPTQLSRIARLGGLGVDVITIQLFDPASRDEVILSLEGQGWSVDASKRLMLARREQASDPAPGPRVRHPDPLPERMGIGYATERSLLGDAFVIFSQLAQKNHDDLVAASFMAGQWLERFGRLGPDGTTGGPKSYVDRAGITVPLEGDMGTLGPKPVVDDAVPADRILVANPDAPREPTGDPGPVMQTASLFMPTRGNLADIPEAVMVDPSGPLGPMAQQGVTIPSVVPGDLGSGQTSGDFGAGFGEFLSTPLRSLDRIEDDEGDPQEEALTDSERNPGINDGRPE